MIRTPFKSWGRVWVRTDKGDKYRCRNLGYGYFGLWETLNSLGVLKENVTLKEFERIILENILDEK